MKYCCLSLLLAAGVVVAGAQTTSEQAKPQPEPMSVVTAPTQTAFSLRYQDITVGTGAEAESGKIYKFYYTGWRATDSVQFDSSKDHLVPVMDKDNKPVLNADGTPKMEPMAITFPQGAGRLIPGMDQAFGGMKVGGKRRVYVPWQLGYGWHEVPAREGNPGIPAKSDLIFDIELLDVMDMPSMPAAPPVSAAPPAVHPAAPVVSAPAKPATAKPATTPKP